MAAYGPGVRIGNCWEDACLLEDRWRDFQRKRERELLTQKINQLQERLFKKVPPSVTKDGFVHFGDTAILLNPDSNSLVEKNPRVCNNLSLSINLDEISIHSPKSLPIPCCQHCGASGSKYILYFKLYLASAQKSFVRFAKKSHLQQVFLTDEHSYLTCWQATFLDPQLRLEHEGFPVPANSKMIITHCHTNQNLAVPRNFWTWSYFGK